MSRYDSEYYFVVSPVDREDLPCLTPDEPTVTRSFRWRPQPAGSPPLVFFNGGGDYQRKLGIRVVTKPPGILFDGSNLVVDDRIHATLRAQNIPDMYLHPVVYLHDDGKRYDNYWYLTFAEQFDCWDRRTSFYCPEPMSFGGIHSYEVVDYHLDDVLLDQTPMARRLLFKMGGTTEGNIVCHQSLLHIFQHAGESGARVVRVDEFGQY